MAASLTLSNLLFGHMVSYETTVGAKRTSEQYTLLSLVTDKPRDIPASAWAPLHSDEKIPRVLVDPETARLLMQRRTHTFAIETRIKPLSTSGRKRRINGKPKPQDAREARTNRFIRTVTFECASHELERIKAQTGQTLTRAQLVELATPALQTVQPMIVVGSLAYDPSGITPNEAAAAKRAELIASCGGDAQLVDLVIAHYNERCAAKLNENEYPAVTQFASAQEAHAHASRVGLEAKAVFA